MKLVFIRHGEPDRAVADARGFIGNPPVGDHRINHRPHEAHHGQVRRAGL